MKKREKERRKRQGHVLSCKCEASIQKEGKASSSFFLLLSIESLSLHTKRIPLGGERKRRRRWKPRRHQEGKDDSPHKASNPSDGLSLSLCQKKSRCWWCCCDTSKSSSEVHVTLTWNGRKKNVLQFFFSTDKTTQPSESSLSLSASPTISSSRLCSD